MSPTLRRWACWGSRSHRCGCEGNCSSRRRARLAWLLLAPDEHGEAAGDGPREESAESDDAWSAARRQRARGREEGHPCDDPKHGRDGGSLTEDARQRARRQDRDGAGAEEQKRRERGDQEAEILQ